MDIFVERVDEDPERQVELELTGPARKDEIGPCVCTGGQLGEEACLADPWFADELERRGSSLADLGEETVDRVELRRAADEVGGKCHLSLPGSTLDQGLPIEKSGWPIQGVRLMSGRPRRGRVGACPATCFTTTTSRISAVSSSPPSVASRARFAIRAALASCNSGGHSIWWTVESASEENALALLPFYVAERTTAVPVSEVQIP